MSTRGRVAKALRVNVGWKDDEKRSDIHAAACGHASRGLRGHCDPRTVEPANALYGSAARALRQSDKS